MKKAIIFLLLMIGTGNLLKLRAQTYPVQVHPVLFAPLPMQLEAFANPDAFSPVMELELQLTDLRVDSREVFLQISVEGERVSFESQWSPGVYPPIILEGGVSRYLTARELAPYFRYENLRGISAETYGSHLPEGPYRFCFRVFDALTGKNLSGEDCVFTYMLLQDPPILIAPAQQELIEYNPAAPILFQWSPRHVQPTPVRYKLRVVELLGENPDPFGAFVSLPPVFETEVTGTSLLLPPEAVLWRAEAIYAWQVTVVNEPHYTTSANFKNQGRSEIHYFNMVPPCEPPLFPAAEIRGAHLANLSWDDPFSGTGDFVIRYRKAGPNFQWFESRTDQHWITLWDLQPMTRYEYQVARACNTINSQWTDPGFFTTGSETVLQDLEACGIAPQLDPRTQAPLEILKVNQEFNAGDFPVKVTEVKGDKGRFTGKGYVSIPYLANIKIPVRFTNVYINSAYQLVQGMVITLYDKTYSNVLSIDELTDRIEDLADVFSGEDLVVLPALPYVIKDEDIKVEDGKIRIKLPGGEVREYDYDAGGVYVITDQAGNQWEIGPDGQVKNIGQGSLSAMQQSELSGTDPEGEGHADSPAAETWDQSVVRITFGAAPKSKFALDRADDPYERESYPSVNLPDGGKAYPIHKLVVEGAREPFLARYEWVADPGDSGLIEFRTVQGRKIPARDFPGSGYFELELEGLHGYRSEEILAVYPGKDGHYAVVSSFFIHHVPRRAPIPVQISATSAEQDTQTLIRELQMIFAEVGISLQAERFMDEVQLDPSFWDRYPTNGILDLGDQGLLEDYPDELNAMIRRFELVYPNRDPEAFQLLLLDSEIQVSGYAEGFMPLNRAFGFLFMGNVSAQNGGKPTLSYLAAHELAHGIFSLRHPEASGHHSALMNQGAGIDLGYQDWQQMYSGKFQFPLMQAAHQGEYTQKEYMEKVFQQLRCAFLNGTTALDTSVFDKAPGTFQAEFEDFGTLTLHLKKGQISMGPKNAVISRETQGSGKKTYHYDLYRLDFDGMVIESKRFNFLSKTEAGLNALQSYLFPSDPKASETDFYQLVNRLQGKTSLDADDLKALKQIVNCGAERFPVRDKYRLVRMIVAYSTREYYEDLILDLMQNSNEDPVSYANQWLELLEKDHYLLKRLFYDLDDTQALVPFSGSENNHSRFLKLLLDWWSVSDFRDPSRYRYIDYLLDDGDLTPSVLAYDGSKWFPRLVFDQIVLETDNVRFDVSVDHQKHGRLRYDFFQPVTLIGEENGATYITKQEVPAIFLAGLIRKDEVHRRLEQWNLALDLGLTFSGIGNLSKLSHLSRLANAGRVLIGGIEVSSGVVEVLLVHTDLFSQDPELERMVADFNGKIQLMLLGTGVIEAQFMRSRRQLQEVLQRNRTDLYTRYPERRRELGILDDYFKLTPAGLRTFSPGDYIAGRAVNRVRPGTPREVVVIGREMTGHVREVSVRLKEEGFSVHIFSSEELLKEQITLDGLSVNWETLMNDLTDTSKAYRRDGLGQIIYDDIPKTLMYRANQAWIRQMRERGYLVLDMGYPKAFEKGPSAFYDMEVREIFGDPGN